MKLFHLYRVEDQTGVSGTGPVVEGVEFSNGWCALRWISNMSTMCFYQSLADVRNIHGHQGRTELVVHDFDPVPRREPVGGSKEFELLVAIIDEAARVHTWMVEKTETSGEVRAALENLKGLVEELERRLDPDKNRSMAS